MRARRIYCIFIIALAAILCIITAINKQGWYHPDEYYQIIEFACYKMGINSFNELGWEYKIAIRPGIQPFIAYYFIKTGNAVGITSPFTIDSLLKIMSAILGLGAIVVWLKATRKEFNEQWQRVFVCGLYCLLWFTPFLITRFTSENWSGALFLLGLSLMLFYKQSAKKPVGYLYLAGLLMGLAFQYRYQAALLVAVVCLFQLFEKNGWKILVNLSAGFCIALAIGALCDHWLYGQWVFPPISYFIENILHHATERYGTMPTGYYWNEVIKQTLPVWAYFLIASTAAALILHPKNGIVWAVFIFILFHQRIAHKELRFLFPLIYLIPYIVGKTIVSLSKLPVMQHPWLRKTMAILFFVALLVNIAGAAIGGTKATGAGRGKVTKYLYDNYRDTPIQIICVERANPWRPCFTLKNCTPDRFYFKMKDMTEVNIKNINEIKNSLFVPNRKTFVILDLYSLWNGQMQEGALVAMGFERKMESVTAFHRNLNLSAPGSKDQYRWFDEGSVLFLYELNEKKRK